jgi:hypothetical protein
MCEVRAAALLIAALLCGACHSPLLRTTPERELLSAGRHHVTRTLALPQTHGHEGCAAQAVAAVLAFADPSLDATALAAELPWHEEGASPVDLLLEVRRRGFAARLERGTWERVWALVQEQRPALVMIDAGPEMQTLTRSVPLVKAMHWAVVSGAARDGSTVLLAARGARHHVVRHDEFMRRWSAADQCLIDVRGGAPRPLPQGGAAPAAPPAAMLVGHRERGP